jgi:hypothetical protein
LQNITIIKKIEMQKNTSKPDIKFIILGIILVFGILKNINLNEIKKDVINGWIDGYRAAEK